MNELKHFIVGAFIGIALGLMLAELRYTSQFRKGVVNCNGIYYTVEVHTNTKNLYEKIRTEQE